MDRLRHTILTHVRHQRYEPRTLRALAADLGIAQDDFLAFEQAVKQLIEEDQVVLGADHTVSLPPPGRQMIGTFRLNARGFGFVIPDAGGPGYGDLFVPNGMNAGALTGDRVKVRVVHDTRRSGGGRSPYTGRVVEILQRAERRYVGTLIRRGTQWFVEPDPSTGMPNPILVRDAESSNAVVGDKVVVELTQHADESRGSEGVVTEVLGTRGEPDTETAAVMRMFGLPTRFEPSVVEDARRAAESFRPDPLDPDREDLRGLFIATIDPPDARDFDDAISIERSEQGTWELGVHIADVASFVVEGTELDREAKKRGNSTYLPRRVVPMLPELLSNGVCSLQENVDRFALSCFITLDAQAHPLRTRFCRSVIRSRKRMTYLEAQALIDDDIREARKHTKSEPNYPRELIEKLKLMDGLAKLIRQRRMKQGMIVLGLPESELRFDEQGQVVDAVPEDTAFTHTLIEMFMVEANEAAARLFASHNVPMVRRVHADPPVQDMTDLRAFARVAGYNIPSHPTRKELQALLDKVRDTPAQHAVHMAVLRTLSKAEYAPSLIGHFALASEHYTHFTSPIRRYCDLVVHRAIACMLRQQRDQIPSEEQLADVGRHCSTTERNSEAAERELTRFFLLQLIERHGGDTFDGTLTGVSSQGVYVQIDRYLVDGFVKIADLPGSEPWRLNRATGALVAQRSGKTISIGDRFRVQVAKCDPARRVLELVVLTESNGKRPGHQPPKGAKATHPGTNNLKKQKPRHPKSRNSKKKKGRR